jgi:hypothetical protein
MGGTRAKIGRSAHANVRFDADYCDMEERGILHRIEEDLAGNWVEALANEGVQSIEHFLAKHLAFLAFLDEA